MSSLFIWWGRLATLARPSNCPFFLIFICKLLKEDLRFTRSLLNHPHYQSGPELQKARIEVTSATCPMGGKKRKSFSSNGNFINCTTTTRAAHFVLSFSLCPCFCFSLLISATETSHTKKDYSWASTQSGCQAAVPHTPISNRVPLHLLLFGSDDRRKSYSGCAAHSSWRAASDGNRSRSSNKGQRSCVC